MNNFDTDNWKSFTIKELFTWNKGTYLSSSDKNDYKGTIPCINGSSLNNGVLTFLDNNIEEKRFKLQKAPCLSLSRVGNAGLTFVQPKDFYIADNAYALKLKNTKGNIFIYLFLSTILNLETDKYSYGRIINSKYFDTKIKLPAISNEQPDWQFMESFIKDKYLKIEKQIKTKIRHRELSLDTTKWKEFLLSDLFDVKLSSGDLKQKDIVSVGVPLISANSDNNGFAGYVLEHTDDRAQKFKSNVLTVDMFCNAFYQHHDFFSVSHGRVNILIPKFAMNKYIGLFIATIINKEKFRFTYGRAVYSSVISNITIKLPVDKHGNPDWGYMENYIKSLPYADLI